MSATLAYDISTQSTTADDSNESSTTTVVNTDNRTANSTTFECYGLQNIWYIYLGIAGTLFISGLFCSICLECSLHYARQRKRTRGKEKSPEGKPSCFLRAQHISERLNSGSNLAGKILMTLYFTFSIASWIGYILPQFTVGPSNYILAQCTPESSNNTYFDLVANLYFALIFFIRFLASRNRIRFWFTINTIIDCLTIPSSMIALASSSRFFGMGFLRSVRFLNIPDVLVYIHVLRGYRSIRITQIMCKFIALWFTGAGFYALVEQFGDFWLWDSNYPNTFPSGANTISYLNAAYFTIVTMATVGYGDVTPSSTLGKVYASIFILTAVGIFASIIPEMVSLLSITGPDKSRYQQLAGEKHIVLCGHLDYASMKNFLQDFNSSNNDASTTKLIFLCPEKMTVKMKTLVKKHPTLCGFYRGDPLVASDLERVRLSLAQCVIVLCNLNGKRPDDEDERTILRTIAIKDYCPDIRIIIQLIQFQSKARLKAIPRWRRGVDSVICISELKLGLIAQNCLVPGFCALMTNLITYSRKASHSKRLHNWRLNYINGAQNELYYVNFSKAFNGLLFSEAVEICFVQLGITLVGIDIIDYRLESVAISINPNDSIEINSANMYAFVIAQNNNEAELLSSYCVKCHGRGNVRKKCRCSTPVEAQRFRRNALSSTLDETDSGHGASGDRDHLSEVTSHPSIRVDDFSRNGDASPSKIANGRVGSDRNIFRRRAKARSLSADYSSSDSFRSKAKFPAVPTFDVTGLFHWIPALPITSALLTRETAHSRRFINHIVLCLFANRDSPMLDLCNFIMPLRSSNVKFDELKDIVVICNAYYIERQWSSLQNFPKLFIYPGSPLNRANLRAVNVPNCSACVILSAAKSHDEVSDLCLIDKEQILCTSNIKAMPKSVHLSSPHMQESFNPDSTGLIGDYLNVFTELLNVKNGIFLGRSDANQLKSDIYMLESYATGRMFNVSVLDSLVTTTYFSRNKLSFIQAMITGVNSEELEVIFAENEGLPGGKGNGVYGKSGDDPEHKSKSFGRLRRMNLSSPPLKDCFQRDSPTMPTFRQLFLFALRQHGLICIGIYRKINLSDSHHDCKRVVLTCPSNTFVLDKTDFVFALQPQKSILPQAQKLIGDLTQPNFMRKESLYSIFT